MIYFIENARAKAIKIGYAVNPQGRLTALQTGSPDRLKLLGFIPGAISDESELHRQFAGLREHGEWFKATKELVAAIRDIIKRQSYSHYVRWQASKITDDLKAERERHMAILSAAVGFPVSMSWGMEPFMSGAKGRRHSYQFQPDLNEDMAGEPGDFWWWYIDKPPYGWHATPHEAADSFLRAWERWRQVHPAPIVMEGQ